MRCCCHFCLLGDSEFPEVVDAMRAHGGIFHPSVPHVAHPHQARRQDVAYTVSQVGFRRSTYMNCYKSISPRVSLVLLKRETPSHGKLFNLAASCR